VRDISCRASSSGSSAGRPGRPLERRARTRGSRRSWPRSAPPCSSSTPRSLRWPAPEAMPAGSSGDGSPWRPRSSESGRTWRSFAGRSRRRTRESRRSSVVSTRTASPTRSPCCSARARSRGCWPGSTSSNAPRSGIAASQPRRVPAHASSGRGWRSSRGRGSSSQRPSAGPAPRSRPPQLQRTPDARRSRGFASAPT
jgi:hypothetical protein